MNKPWVRMVYGVTMTRLLLLNDGDGVGVGVDASRARRASCIHSIDTRLQVATR